MNFVKKLKEETKKANKQKKISVLEFERNNKDVIKELENNMLEVAKMGKSKYCVGDFKENEIGNPFLEYIVKKYNSSETKVDIDTESALKGFVSIWISW
jgi:hypothetical protein